VSARYRIDRARPHPECDDRIGGILGIIEPLEEQGVSCAAANAGGRIERFIVAEYDNHIIGCSVGVLPDERVGELRRWPHPISREGYGEALMKEIEQRAQLRLTQLYVLTTKTALVPERGFRDDRRSAATEAALQITSASRRFTAL
jgi:N-acetylglutamate synthase-like GNAT family acetyltransferase